MNMDDAIMGFAVKGGGISEIVISTSPGSAAQGSRERILNSLSEAWQTESGLCQFIGRKRGGNLRK